MPCIEKLNYRKLETITNFKNIGLFKIDKGNVYEADFNNLLSNMNLDTISNSSASDCKRTR